jgi:di/tricarboxylate transporter
MIEQSYLVLGLILILILVLYKNWISTTLAFLSIACILLVFGVISPSETLHGFANEQLAVIILLLILSNVLKKSPAVSGFFRRVLKPTDSPKWFLTKLITMIGGLSAFFNNTPLVAMSIPYVFEWSKTNKTSPSKFLIPLSYASILGGLITLIGTSTTLVVNALAVKHGAPSLGMFDLTIIGFVMAIIGGLYLITIGYNILPSNQIHTTYENSQPIVRQYFMETVVSNDSLIIGKTVSDAGLRDLDGLFLVEILKENQVIRPVGSDTIVEAGDKLFFAGDLNTITQLDVHTLGLSLPKDCETSTGRRHDMTELVVSHNSELIGITIKESNFRAKYDGAILAIHRNGERIWGKLGQVKLKAGDVLLVMAGKNFAKRLKDGNSMYQISNIKYEEEPENAKILVLFIGLIASIVLTALQIVPFFTSLIVLLLLSLVMKLATPKDIKEGIDYDLIVIIGIGLALGVAMENSGASELISNAVTSLTFLDNKLMFMFALFIIINVMASIVTAKAAVAILIPVILRITGAMDFDAEPIVLLIAFAAAANFATPIGYQTNLMVYGPGRYSFKDFMKVGIPLTLIYMLVCVFMLDFLYNIS